MSTNTAFVTIEKVTSSESYFNSEEYSRDKNKHLLNAYPEILMPKNVQSREIFMAFLGTTCNTITHIEPLSRKDYEEIFPLIEQLKDKLKASSFSHEYLEQDFDNVRLILEPYRLDDYIHAYLESYAEKLWMSFIGIFNSGDPDFAEKHDKIYE